LSVFSMLHVIRTHFLVSHGSPRLFTCASGSGLLARLAGLYQIEILEDGEHLEVGGSRDHSDGNASVSFSEPSPLRYFHAAFSRESAMFRTRIESTYIT
jgi:hypothetical protein